MAYTGFKGELKRFAGDAAKQRAIDFAKTTKAVVMFSNDFKCRGINNCFVVVDTMQNFAKASVAADERGSEEITCVAYFTEAE